MSRTVNDISVDSLRIYIPYKYLNPEQSDLFSTIETIHHGTGEVKREQEKSYCCQHEHGITTYAYSTLFKYPAIRILLDSKLLGANYFEGITEDTIPEIVKAINSHGIVSITQSQLLQCPCNDIDIKHDYNSAHDDVEALRERVNIRYKCICQVTAKKTNRGIQVSERHNNHNGESGLPMFKLYRKDLELKHSSKKQLIHNKILTEKYKYRKEVTLSNDKHIKKYGIKSTDLKTVLDTVKTKGENIMERIEYLYFRPACYPCHDDILNLMTNGLNKRQIIDCKTALTRVDELLKAGIDDLESIMKIVLISVSKNSKKSVTAITKQRYKDLFATA